jgi:hypothetical protein
MLVYLAVAAAISVYDLYYLKKKKLKKDLAMHIFLMLLVSAMGILYLRNPNQKSAVEALFEIVNIQG